MFTKFFKTQKSQNHKNLSLFDMAGFSEYMGNRSSLDAYKTNVIVYRCVNLIAQSASHVPWVILKNQNGLRKKLYSHPLHKLLNHPNPSKAGADFFTEVIASLLLFGNAYVLAVGRDDTQPQELHLLHAKSVEVVVRSGRQVAYKYRHASGETLYPINPTDSKSRVMHLRTYHPTDPTYGLSCLEAASLPIDIHSSASKWNSSLLRNGARPSGALVMKDSSGYLSDDQFERLKEQLYEKYSGASNSGKPLLLEGGLDWREMSISPKDMDFIESKNSAAREIALAFGMPPQLLGINGDNTYSNMQEARLALWEETLIPLLDKIANAMTHWFAGWFHDGIVIDFDRDSISALTDKRENLWTKIADSNFMTVNEKRAFVGLGPIDGGDVVCEVMSRCSTRA